jgi:phosphonate transport system substrate-binding protein
MATCERCHREVSQAFRESPHFRKVANAAATPICTDCHSAAGGSVLSGDAIPRRCASCHGASGTAGDEWVVAKAPDLLQLLRRVTLARAMVEEHLEALRRSGANAGAAQADLDSVDARFRTIPIEWHRFNLKDVETRARFALDALESLHDRLERRVAAESRPAPGGLRNQRALTPAPGRVLRFAVASMADPLATYEAYVRLFDDLGRALARPYRFVQRGTYREVNDLLLRGELDLAFICSGAYAILPPDAPVEIVAVPIVGGTSVYHSLIIVRKDSRAQRFEDLIGVRFAFTDPLSNTGYLYPMFRAAMLGGADDFFGSTLFSGSHERSVLAVYRRLADGAAVDDLVFAQVVTPDSLYWDQFRIVETSPAFAIPPVVAPTSVPAELRTRMREFFLGLARTPEGQQRLAALGFDGFTAGGKEHYASIREMLRVAGAPPR